MKHKLLNIRSLIVVIIPLFFLSMFYNVALGCATKNSQGGNRLCKALTISGNTNPCPGATEFYSINYNQNGEEPCITWTVVGGAITSAQGSYSVTNPTTFTNCDGIVADYAFPGITVVWNNSGPRSLTVTAKSLGISNLCGTKTTTLNIGTRALNAIGSMLGNFSPVCISNPLGYSIPPVAGATNYVWTAPPGWTFVSASSGSNCTSVSIRSNGKNTGGTITVQAYQSCGVTSKSAVISALSGMVSNVAISSTVSCANEDWSRTTSVPGALNYTWKLYEADGVTQATSAVFTFSGLKIISSTNGVTYNITYNGQKNVKLGITTNFNGCSGSEFLYDIQRTDALNFDGVNDVVQTPAPGNGLNLGSGNYTMEIFFKASTTGSGLQALLSKRETAPAGTDGFLIALSNGRVLAQLKGVPNWVATGGADLRDGACHHLAIVNELVGATQNQLTFYLDGNTTPLFTYRLDNSRPNISSPGPLRIGYDKFSFNPFLGLIGEVRIWNTVRTIAQIRVGRDGITPPQSGLVGFWDMRDAANQQVVADLSGYGNNATLGATSAVATDDPTFVSNCALTCYVNGNFRTASSYPVYQPEVIANDTLSTTGLNTSVNLFPNPAAENFTVFVSDISKDFKIQVTDVNGAIVKEVLGNDHSTLIYTAGLKNGIYIVSVIQDGKSIRKRLEIIKD